jgi:DNA replication protein DnaC
MMDELLRLSRDDMTKYSKKLKYYSRLRILFIDDFCISRYSEDGIKILYHLLKSRADLHYPTVFNTQYEPSEWSQWLSDDPGCFGKLDGIRRRLTTGFTVEIIKL